MMLSICTWLLGTQIPATPAEVCQLSDLSCHKINLREDRKHTGINKRQFLPNRISSFQRVQRVQIHNVVVCKTARYGKSERGQSAESQKGRKKILPVLSAWEVLSSSSRPIRTRDDPAGPPTCRNDPHRGVVLSLFFLSSPFGGRPLLFFSPSLSFQRINSPPPSLPPPPSYHRSFLLNFISTNPFSLFDAALVSSI